MRPAELAAIRSLPLFHDMADAHFASLMSAALLQQFPPRVQLIAEGDLPDFLHVVVEGTIEMFASHEGRETTLDIIEPLSTFILAAVIRDEPYLKSARTLSPARILMLPAQAVREIFSRDAAFARAVVGELAARYRGIVRALKNEKLRTSGERVANWILKANLAQGSRDRVRLPYDKRTLAAYLGMTPENLSRSLTLLEQHGTRNSGKEIAIDDRAALQRFARPSTLID